ncbi:MAG: hypothetical protein AUG51_06460 [Acidobacteria bacterium 13_1_20CM_3_53_8]|nr:MAG: hypothetical protein AUG51_06460 [Acidobacteria bacterium 13_1_20CM_3_53_8]
MALCALCLSLLAQESTQDRVTLRDGSEMAVERSRVKLIRLGGATNDAPDEQAETDLVVMRDNRRSTGHVSFVTDQSVIQSGNELKRDEVALIRFADAGHTLTANPRPSPSPSTSPSASPAPSPSPSPGSTPAGGNTDNSNQSGQNSSGGTDTMPWFNTDGCDFIQQPYVFVDGTIDTSEGGQQRTRCRMWINVCGTIIERVKFVDSNGGECWRRENLDAPKVCCTVWGRYKQSPTSRYNPQVDADGDGIPNDRDDNPLGPNKPKVGNAASNSNRR